jgi:hypothetical protein
MVRIVPGNLPPDQTRIKFAEVLAEFVRTTEVTDFADENFISNTAATVVTMSEAPATSSRYRGMLWFKRGEGALYTWVVVPQPSAFFAPSVTSSGTEALWVRISDGRDQIVRQRFTAASGDILFANTTISEWKAVVSNDTPPRYTLVMAATAITGGSLGGLFCRNPFMVPDPRLVSQVAAVDGQYHAARAFGYVNAFAKGPGAEGTDPIHFTQRPGDSFHEGFGRGCTSWSENLISLGFIVDSANSGVRTLRKIFKYPTLTNLPHLAGLNPDPS